MSHFLNIYYIDARKLYLAFLISLFHGFGTIQPIPFPFLPFPLLEQEKRNPFPLDKRIGRSAYIYTIYIWWMSSSVPYFRGAIQPFLSPSWTREKILLEWNLLVRSSLDCKWQFDEMFLRYILYLCKETISSGCLTIFISFFHDFNPFPSLLFLKQEKKFLWSETCW